MADENRADEGGDNGACQIKELVCAELGEREFCASVLGDLRQVATYSGSRFVIELPRYYIEVDVRQKSSYNLLLTFDKLM